MESMQIKFRGSLTEKSHFYHEILCAIKSIDYCIITIVQFLPPVYFFMASFSITKVIENGEKTKMTFFFVL